MSKHIFKDRICLKKYPDVEMNKNGRYVSFKYNTKTNKVFIPSDQIKNVSDIPLIKEKVNEQIHFLIRNNFKSYSGKF
tara:strand:- start:154 stop:387 length:234 start_codon:yes stop_codon:yes gene_type:complete